MSLSGSFQNTFTSGYALRLEWSATQSITNNQSTVSVSLYWMSLGSSYTVNSSASKTASITIEGTAYAKAATASLADLNGNQKKLIHSASKVITHNSDGTFPDLDLSATFDCEVTLNSKYWASVTVSGSSDLNTIPRASSITSSASFTGGTNFTITVNPADSSFRHIARVYVDGVQVYATPSGSKFASSVTTSITQSTVFTELAQTASKGSEIQVDTYNSAGTKIGSTASKTGTCTAPAASTFNLSATSFDIGTTFTAGIIRSNSQFVHTFKIKNGTTVGYTVTDQTTSASLVTSGATATTLYGWVPNSNSMTVTIECTTYYGTIQVRTPTTKTIIMNVVSSNPTFSGSWTFKDGATAVTAITGQTANSPTIVQSLSSVVVTIPIANKAVAINGATMVNYVVTLNGVSKTVAYDDLADVVFTYGSTTSSTTPQTLIVDAVDSRGNKTSTNKSVTVVPYSNPVLTTDVFRTNGFDAETTLTSSGSISPVLISTNKNAITKLEYRYKESTAAWVNTWTAIVYTGTGMPTYTGTNVVFATQIDQTKAYNFEIRITDKFGTTVTIAKTVPVGQPLFFIDSVTKRVGVGQFPTSRDLEVGGAGYIKAKGLFGTYLDDEVVRDYMNGNVTLSALGNHLYLGYKNTTGVRLSSDLYDSSGTKVILTKAGALDMNNLDITSANIIAFDDTSTGNEGINFIKTGAIVGSVDYTNDYDTLRALDGIAYLNTKEMSVIDTYSSNTNGSYIRYTNGMQICWIHITPTDQALTATLGSLFTGNRTWTFPAAFLNIPTVNCGQFNWGTGGGWGGVDGQTTTSATLRGIDVASRAVGTACDISAIAIGEWK